MSGFVTADIAESDDLRHRVAAGVRTRDSWFWNLVLPDEQVAVQVYAWVDGRGVAGRQVVAYVPDRDQNVVRNAYNIDLGEDADLRSWQCAGLRVNHPEPLRVAELAFDSGELALDYRFTARHRPFSYRENPGGCPPWMALNRYEQAGRASGSLRIGERVIPFDDVWAHRDHSWGRRNWSWVQHWKWIVAGVPSGGVLNAMLHLTRGELGVNGYVVRGGEPVALVDGRVTATFDDDMSQASLAGQLVDAGGRTTRLEMERFAIFRLPFGSDSLLFEAACRVSIDGEPGTGQFEALWPRSYIERLVAER